MDETKDETIRARLPCRDHHANATWTIFDEKAPTPNLQNLGPSLWLFVDSADYLRISRLQTLVVYGLLGLYGCVL
jgi:hypothetical protein